MDHDDSPLRLPSDEAAVARVVDGLLRARTALRDGAAERIWSGVETMRRRRFPVLRWAAAATVLAAAALLAFLLNKPSSLGPGDAVFRAADLPEQRLIAGTRFSSPAPGTISWADGVRIDLVTSTEVGIGTGSSPRLALISGRGLIDADPGRARTSAVAFDLPAGRTTVLGTRYTLAANGSGSLLEVHRGSVEFLGQARAAGTAVLALSGRPPAVVAASSWADPAAGDVWHSEARAIYAAGGWMLDRHPATIGTALAEVPLATSVIQTSAVNPPRITTVGTAVAISGLGDGDRVSWPLPVLPSAILIQVRIKLEVGEVYFNAPWMTPLERADQPPGLGHFPERTARDHSMEIRLLQVGRGADTQPIYEMETRDGAHVIVMRRLCRGPLSDLGIRSTGGNSAFRVESLTVHALQFEAGR